MALFNLEAHRASHINGPRFSVVFDLTGKPAPFPARQVEAKTPADAFAALDTYKAEAALDVAVPVAISIRLARGQRAPRGWNAAFDAAPRYHLVMPAAAVVEG